MLFSIISIRYRGLILGLPDDMWGMMQNIFWIGGRFMDAAAFLVESE